VPIQLFPLTGGMNQRFDVRLLPDGVLANAVNCEMDRVGRVAPRARYVAIGTGVASPSAGALVAYDLVSFLDRLFVVGDDSRFGCPANLYEYLGAGVAQPWRPTSPVADAVPRLGLATRVRDISRAPDQAGSALFVGAAAFGGFTGMCWGTIADSGAAFFSVTRSADDQPVFCAQLDTASSHPCQHCRVFALSDRFLIVGMSLTFKRISISKFAPATDTAVASVVTDIFAAAANPESFGACKVAGSDQIVIAARVAGSIKVRRLNNAGTVQVPSGGQYADIVGSAGTDPFAIAIEADSSSNQLTVAVLDAGSVGLYSYNLSTGAAIGTGPFDAFPNDTTNVHTEENVALVRVSATTLRVLATRQVVSDQQDIKSSSYVVSTNTVANEDVAVADAVLTTRPQFFSATGALLFGIRVGDNGLGGSPNILCSWLQTPQVGIQQGARLEIVKDFEVAGVPDDDGLNPLGDLVFDSTSDRYYWGNAAADADSSLAPLLTEFAYGSTDRRQTAEYGGHLYFTGGAPLVFDGVTVVESGFQLRPRIISLTPSVAVNGELTETATYNYRVHSEWTDGRGDLHLSPPSAIEKTTLASGQNLVTLKTSTPHSWRRSVGCHPGSAVTQVASRTLATADEAPAVLFGVLSINPPGGVLNALTLKLLVGATNYTVTFDASATTQADVLSQINAIVNPLKVTVTAPDGFLVFTSVETGTDATMQMQNGTANTLLGLTQDEVAAGTTEVTTGENFQRASTNHTRSVDEVAEFLNISDNRPDEHDPIEDDDLIRQQVLYSQGNATGGHFAPPPSEFVASGRERIIWSGHPKRSRYTATKIIVAGEPAECAQDGIQGYVGHITGDVQAAFVLGDSLVFWTRNQTWFVTGAGPNRAGQGEFSSPQCVNKRVGIAADGWRSIVEDEAGVWFQGQDNQIYHCSRGGDVAWKGREVRDYLEDFPVITAATARHGRQEIAFAVTNTAGTQGGILRYRPDAEAWMFDDVGAVTALTHHQGQLAYVQAGVVYLQDAAPGTGAMPTLRLDSGLFQGFQALGYGALEELGVLATYRGPCTIKLKIGTDGDTFPSTIATWDLTALEYTVGQRVQLLVDSPQQTYDAFAMSAEVSSIAGSTEGAWLHAFAVKSESMPDFVRLAPSRRQ
jgi:hypothetical protein